MVEFLDYGRGRGLAHESLLWASAGHAHGWTTSQVVVPALNPGQGADVKVPVAVAAGASGSVALTATYRASGKQASGSTTVTVTP